MPLAPVTVKGGLPLVADVWFSGPDYYGEYDAGVNALYWRTKDSERNPTKHGKEVSLKIYDSLEAYWECDVIDQASDWIAYHEGD